MKKLMALILAVIMVLGLAACGKNPSESTAGSSAAPGQSTEAGTKAPEVKWAKEVVFAEGNTAFEDPDPQASSALQNTKQYLLTHDRLVYLNPKTNEIEPMLAKSWDISPDGLTYTFHLRDDVYFHNGEKFTADDVVFTMERGRESANSQVNTNWSLVTFEKVDDYTVKGVLSGQNADFLFRLSVAYMGILNRKACEADNVKGSWIGTGLWILEEFWGQDGATWVRNDKYWGESTPTERLTHRHIPEAASRLIAIENGEISAARALPNLSNPDIEANPDLQLYRVVSTMCNYITFNQAKEGPWNDVNFRKAVAYAIDYDALIQAAFDGFGEQAKTFWGYSDMFGYAPPSEGYSYDPDKAREYLAKTNYNGETIELMGYGTTWGKHSIIIKDMLAKVGINIEAFQAESAAYTPRVTAGDMDAVCYTYSFLRFGSSINNFINSAIGPWCYTNAVDGALPHKAEIQQLLDESFSTLDTNKRKEQYAKLQELWMDDLVTIPYSHQYQFVTTVTGFEGTEWIGSQEFDYRYIRVPEK